MDQLNQVAATDDGRAENTDPEFSANLSEFWEQGSVSMMGGWT